MLEQTTEATVKIAPKKTKQPNIIQELPAEIAFAQQQLQPVLEGINKVH